MSYDILKTGNSPLVYNGRPISTTWYVAPTPPGPSYPTDGLIARWQFEDNLNDSHTVGPFNLTNMDGTPAYGTGLINRCAVMSGTWDGAYNTAINSSYQLNRSAWTVSFWVKTSSTSYLKFISTDTGGTKTEIVMNNSGIFTGKTNGAIGIYRGAYDTYNVFTSGAMNNGAWHHIAAGYDGSNLWLYCDNSSAGTKANTDNQSSGKFAIGSTGGYAQSNQSIDQVYFYNKTLSAGEISQLYNSGSGV